MLNSNIAFNVFRPPLVGFKLGSDDLVEMNHNNLELRRDHDLFKSLPNFIMRKNVESFLKSTK